MIIICIFRVVDQLLIPHWKLSSATWILPYSIYMICSTSDTLTLSLGWHFVIFLVLVTRQGSPQDQHISKAVLSVFSTVLCVHSRKYFYDVIFCGHNHYNLPCCLLFSIITLFCWFDCTHVRIIGSYSTRILVECVHALRY